MPSRTHDPRESLDELDSTLRGRLLGVDEPVARGDWAAVVERSSGLRQARRRSFALATSGAAALSLACALVVVPLFRGVGQPVREAVPVRLSLSLGGASDVVLYSTTERARFLDESGDRAADQPPARRAAIARSLTGGPFQIRPALARAASASPRVGDGPLPGDRALVSFRVFTSRTLGTPAGSAVLTCEYGLDRRAYCDGSVDLEDGVRLTGTGTLDADARHYTLMVTGGQSRRGVGRGVLTASPGTGPSELD